VETGRGRLDIVEAGRGRPDIVEAGRGRLDIVEVGRGTVHYLIRMFFTEVLWFYTSHLTFLDVTSGQTHKQRLRLFFASFLEARLIV
jgi:hypothetical protein